MTNLDSILSGKADAAPESSHAPEKPAQPRDELGQYASPKGVEPPAGEQQPEPPAPPEEAPQAPPEEQEPPPQQAPVAALKAERGKRQEAEDRSAHLERQLAEMAGQMQQLERMIQRGQQPQPQPQPEPEPPDVWSDPASYVQHGIKQALSPLQQEYEQRFDAMNRMMAESAFGADTVQEAFDAMASAFQAGDRDVQADHQRIMASTNRYGELVKWHKRRQAMSEIGDDPAAYREKLKAELLAEINGGQGGQPAPQQQPAKPAPVMPSNLAGARGAGSRSGPAWGGPQSLQDIFDRRPGK